MAFAPTGSEKQTRQAVLAVFLLALACRIFFLLWIDEPILFYKYPFFAEKLAAGQNIGERIVDLSPFYLYFTTVFAAVFGSHWEVLKGVQALLGAVVAAGVAGVGMRWINRPAGVVAGLIYAVYGNAIVLESTLEPTVFVLLFNLAAVFFLMEADVAPAGVRWRRAAAAGVFSGLSIVTKPSFLLFLPLGAVWLFFRGRRPPSWRVRVGAPLLFGLAAFLVVAPVTVRNHVRLGDRVLVTADAGKVFYHGNAKGATALEWTGLPDEGLRSEGAGETDFAHVLFRETARSITGLPLSPSEASRFWFRRAWSDIREDPARYARLLLEKAVFFFNDYEMHFIASAYVEYRESRRYPFLRFGVLSALGLTGMLLGLRRLWKWFPLCAPIAVYFCSALVFIVQSRYRLPAVPYLCLFSGYALWCLREWWRRRERGKWAGSAAVVLLFFAFGTLPLRQSVAAAERWQTATRLHYQMRAQPMFEQGDYTSAVVHLDACLALVPDFVPAYNLRGKTFALMGENAKAEADFRRVIALRPQSPQGYKNLGFLYLVLQEPDRAAQLLRRAEAVSPGDPAVRSALDRIR